MTFVYHVLTPGDHFSPRTGSALPTVVHGLAAAARSTGAWHQYPQRVLLANGTFEPRYDSAEALCYDAVGQPGRLQRYLDVAVGRLGRPRRGAAAYFAPVAERLRDEEPGIVLAHNAPVLPWLLRDSPHQVMVYAHNDLFRSFSRFEASHSLRSMSRLICVSASLAAQLSAALPPSLRGRVRTVGNGVDTRQFFPAAGERDPGPLRVMFVGRAIPQKGVDILLTAAGLLQRADIEYLIVGSHGFDGAAKLSPYEQKLRTLAARTTSTVHFKPFVDRAQLPALLQRADVLVIPSRWAEPSGLTVGEGLATGVPVVAASAGGIPEVLGDAGVLFDPAQPGQLADAIGALADDPGRRNRLGQAGRRRAEQHDWRWAWGQLQDVLDDATTPPAPKDGER